MCTTTEERRSWTRTYVRMMYSRSAFRYFAGVIARTGRYPA